MSGQDTEPFFTCCLGVRAFCPSHAHSTSRHSKRRGKERRANLKNMKAAHSSVLGLGRNVSAFPTRAIIVLAFCRAVNAYAFISMMPYVGTMVTELLDLESTNNSGERWMHFEECTVLQVWSYPPFSLHRFTLHRLQQSIPRKDRRRRVCAAS